jgi:hypothetical protein
MSKKDVIEAIKTIREKLLTNDFHPLSCERGKRHIERAFPLKNLDLRDYAFMFTGIIDDEVSVIKCDYDTFLEGNFDLFDASPLRFYMGFRKNLRKEDKTPYELSCEYWENKIGNMDVAEWHLLIYEE